MTIPNITQPTVIRARERPDLAGTFLTALLRGMEQAQERERLRLEEERLKLEKARQKQVAEQAAQETALREQTGAGLLAGLPALEPPEQATIPLPGPIGAQPFAQVPLPGGPFSTAAQGAMLAGATPGAIPGLFREMLPLAQEARVTRAEAAQARAARELETSVTGLPEQQQGDVKRFVAFKNAGVEVPVDMQRALFPSLFPEGVEPALWNVALKAAVLSDGALTMGQAARGVGIKAPLGALEDFRFPAQTGTQQKLSETQLKARMYATQMRVSNQILEDFATRGVNISLPAQVVRDMKGTLARGGGVVGLGGRLLGTLANVAISPEQQQVIQAQLSVANAYRYLVSGQQTSDQEFGVIFTYIVEDATDKPEVRLQKRAFRRAIIESAEEVFAGTAREADASEQLAALARQQNAPPEVVAALEAAAERVRTQGARPQAGGLPAGPGLTADNLSEQALRQLLDEMAKGRRLQILQQP